jgi:metallo-beta-lactamase class B
MTRVVVFAALLSGIAGQALTPDNQPIEPYRIADNLFYVGSSGISSYLITSSSGHIVIDAGYPETAPQIESNIAKLGFKLSDVKILLNTQAHFDHAGGFAELKRATGARLLASPEDAAMIEGGGRGDFNFGDQSPFPPVRVDRRLKDRDEVRVGNVVLTAHFTPGHTKGCTTWTWDTRDRGRTYHVAVLCGLTILDGTKVSGMPAYQAIQHDYERTFEVLKFLPCDIFLGAHPAYYDGTKKAAEMRAHPDGPNPFVDPDGYRTYIAQMEKRFRDQLAHERR